MLTAEALAIGYRSRRGTKPVARNLSLHLDAGEFVCLLGPNGAGKSTLMRTIAGIQPPLAGSVVLDGVDVRTLTPNQRARRLSVVLTERATAGLLTGYAMVCLGRFPHTGWFGSLAAEDRDAVRKAMELTGAQAFGDRFVAELSDGERQRVMVARALAQEPRLMILDEITAFLDLPRRIEIVKLLGRIASETERSVLISTHDLDLALRTADRIWLLHADGTLVAGAPEDLVLDGSFAKVFADEGIEFDPLHGSFSLGKTPRTGIALSGGDAVQRAWTIRALERNGFRALDDPGPPGAYPSLELLGNAGWRLRAGSPPRSFDKLYDLVRELRKITPEPSKSNRLQRQGAM